MATPPDTTLLDRLTARERQIAEHYAQGQTYKEAAKALHVSPSTVRNHITTIYRKLEIGNKVELIQLLQSDVESITTLLFEPSSESVKNVFAEERRQVTVLIAKLHALPIELDEIHTLIQRYHQYVTEIAQQYQGYIARYDSSIVTFYFGYPKAHEDDAERAIYSGLQITDHHELQISAGIDSGAVVFSAAPNGEPVLSGMVADHARQIAEQAPANTLILSNNSRNLSGEGFHYKNTELAALSSWQVTGIKTSVRFEARPPKLTPLIGREVEANLLLDRWALAQQREGQLVVLTGEAGIGKSRVVHTLLERIDKNTTQLQRYQCSPFYTQSALYPFIDELNSYLSAADSTSDKLGQLLEWVSSSGQPAERVVPLLATLLSLSTEERYPPLQLSAQKQKQDTLTLLAEVLLARAEQQPLLVIIEDVHWLDPTSLELLQLLAGQIATASILIVVTTRPELKVSWGEFPHISKLTINRLNSDQVLSMVDAISETQTLPSYLRNHIASKVDGVPLFIEEVTKAILESDTDKNNNEATQLGVPATLYDSLLSRLDRLGEAKAIAQIGAVIGRKFDRDLLVKVVNIENKKLNERLDQLVDAGLLFQHGKTDNVSYLFKHALIRDVSYDTLLQNKRQILHAKIAEVLETDYSESEPELLAQHYTEAGLMQTAIVYWQKAGEQAALQSLYNEAESHFKEGLKLLLDLPEQDETREKELELLTALGPMLASHSYGNPELTSVYSRINDLCKKTERISVKIPALQGLRQFHLVRSELSDAYSFGKELLCLSKITCDYHDQLEACRAIGTVKFHLGDLLNSKNFLEKGIKLGGSLGRVKHDIRYAGHPTVTCQMYLSLLLWIMGYPQQAYTISQQSILTARNSRDLFSLADALYYRLAFLQLLRSLKLANREINDLLKLTDEQGFILYFKAGRVIENWLLAARNLAEANLDRMLDYLTFRSKVGHKIWRPYDCILIAEVYKDKKQFKKGLNIIQDALIVIDKTQEIIWLPEVHRQKGEILSAMPEGNLIEAEYSFQRAIQVAQSLHAKSWELRAAMSLARLWHVQGKRGEAYKLLAPVYNWFTEGFDTADLKDAKTLLDELA